MLLNQLRRTLHLRLAARATKQGERAKAVAFLNMATGLSPADPHPWFRLALALEDMANVSAAVTAYYNALKISPHHAGAYARLARIAAPTDLGYRVLPSLAYHCLMPLDESAHVTVLQHNLSKDEYYSACLSAAMRIGRASPYERHRAFAAQRRPRFNALRQRAHRDLQRFDWAAAKASIASLLTYEPNQPNMWVQLGHAYKETAAYEQAAAVYRTAISWDPYDPDPHLHLGHALKLDGYRALAISSYSNAWRLSPGYPGVEQELRSYAGWTSEMLSELSKAVWTSTQINPREADGPLALETKPRGAILVTSSPAQPPHLTLRAQQILRAVELRSQIGGNTN